LKTGTVAATNNRSVSREGFGIRSASSGRLDAPDRLALIPILPSGLDDDVAREAAGEFSRALPEADLARTAITTSDAADMLHAQCVVGDQPTVGRAEECSNHRLSRPRPSDSRDGRAAGLDAAAVKHAAPPKLEHRGEVGAGEDHRDKSAVHARCDVNEDRP
jgi:hypothetical protein